MYGYFKGEIEDVLSDRIYIDVMGVGYSIRVANPYSFQKGSIVKVYTHLQVREDDLTLFGFTSLAEYEFFKKLLGVKGIGPKSALSIIASGDIAKVIDAIDSGNVEFISKFPGIGPKASQQIVLDLKGKLVTFDDRQVSKESELVSTLEALGYKKQEIKNVVKNINLESPLELQIKEALKAMVA